MRVHRIQRENENDILFELLDDNEEPIAAISGFMRHLHVRGCSPNTLAAYIYDLQHFVQFLKEQQLTYQQFNPAHSLAFLEYLSTLPSRKPSQQLGLVLSTTTSEGDSTTRLSPTTINRIFAAVSSFYEYLILSGQWTSYENPFTKSMILH